MYNHSVRFFFGKLVSDQLRECQVGVMASSLWWFSTLTKAARSNTDIERR
jgi:hypothetical protein